MKQHWNTQVIADLITRNFPEYEIKIMEQGGSYDTSEIRVWLAASSLKSPDDAVSVFGMDEENIFDTPDDVDVDRIHCTSCAKYGMVDATPLQLRVVANLLEMFEKEGYDVTTDGWESYF